MMAGLLLNGCEPPSSIQKPEQASAAAGHQHDSDGVDGSDHQHHHDHDHDHPHDHHQGHAAVKPSHGGRIIPIGHSHHSNEATHYYAEVISPEQSELTLYLITTDEHGMSHPVQVEAEAIAAYAAPLDRKAGVATELNFLPSENGDHSVWSTKIPESLNNGSGLSIVIPKVTLGGEWQNFSFQTSSLPRRPKPNKTRSEDSE